MFAMYKVTIVMESGTLDTGLEKPFRSLLKRAVSYCIYSVHYFVYKLFARFVSASLLPRTINIGISLR